MSNAELELITAVCENKDIAVAMQSHNINEMFTAYRDVWDFVANHYSQYREVPPLAIISKNFEDFEPAPVDAATPYYLDKLRQDFVAGELRKIILKAGQSLEDNGGGKTLAKMMTELSKISKFTTSARDVDLTDFDDAERYFKATREKAANNQGVVGIPTGFSAFDSAYRSGAAPGHLIVPFGYSGKMKSFFTALWAVRAWQMGVKPLVISLEMTPEEYRNRAYAMMNPGKFSINDMFVGDVDTDSMREWARRAFEDKPPFIVPSMSGHMDVTPNVVQSYIDIHKPGLVVLDYTQLMMDNAKSKEMTARMMNLTQELKSLAQRNELPVIAISSVKDGDKSDRDSPPGIDQLMASRQIEFNATLAFSVHLHDHGILEINGAKNRNGPKFNFGIRVDADKGVFVEEFDF